MALVTPDAPSLLELFGPDFFEGFADVADQPKRGERRQRRRQVRIDARGTRLRLVAVLAMIVAAYHHSLYTLFQNLSLDTPLAYVGLVPIISLGLAITKWRLEALGPEIHDRQVDYIVGLPLLVGATAANFLLPAKLSTQFWLLRLDMVTLPFFVAGAVAIVLGSRAIWRLRLPIGFLFLAWPFPFTFATYNWLGSMTNVTISAVAAVVRVVPVAVRDSSGDGSLFQITHNGSSFPLSVASTCSGANSLIGFGLVGLAMVALMKGSRWRKAVWFFVGMSIVWAANIVRILAVFAAAQRWGQGVALTVFHPYIGITFFMLTIAFMLVLMRPFRLSFPSGVARVRLPVAHRPKAWKTAVITACSFAMALTVLNSDFTRFELVATNLGTAKVAAFGDRPPHVAGWSQTRKVDEFTWAERYFGSESTWKRYSLSPISFKEPAHPGPETLWTSSGVIADVITNSSLDRFNAFGVEACYQFHGYSVADQQTVDLGGGIAGTALSWKEPGKSVIWTTVFWHWPVVHNGKTTYERVTLLMSDTGHTRVIAPGVGALASAGETVTDGLLRTKTKSNTSDPNAQAKLDLMVGLARRIISTQPHLGTA